MEDQILDSDINYDDKKVAKVELLRRFNFAVLYFLTFGLYSIWWQYKTWKFFKQRENLNIIPEVRAIFFIFFFFFLLKKIKNYARGNGVNKSYSSEGLFGLYLFSFFFSNST